MIDIKKYVKDKGLADVLLTGSITKPIYLDALLNDFEQELVKNLTIPVVSQQRELLVAFREWMRLKHYEESPTNDRIDEFLSNQ